MSQRGKNSAARHPLEDLPGTRFLVPYSHPLLYSVSQLPRQDKELQNFMNYTSILSDTR